MHWETSKLGEGCGFITGALRMQLGLNTKYSRGAYYRSRLHQQSIGYQNFNKVGIEFQ